MLNKETFEKFLNDLKIDPKNLPLFLKTKFPNQNIFLEKLAVFMSLPRPPPLRLLLE